MFDVVDYHLQHFFGQDGEGDAIVTAARLTEVATEGRGHVLAKVTKRIDVIDTLLIDKRFGGLFRPFGSLEQGLHLCFFFGLLCSSARCGRLLLSFIFSSSHLI